MGKLSPNVLTRQRLAGIVKDMNADTYTATTSSQIVHKVYDRDNGFGVVKSYTLCNGQVANRVTKVNSPATCKRCGRAS